MVLNYGLIRRFYEQLPGLMQAIQKNVKRPLTLSEKLLYAHMTEILLRKRGEDYVDFKPDRVAMQDATAQMALLQFMTSGLDKVAIPSSVHCDHLITAEHGAEKDLNNALTANEEVYKFLSSVSAKHGLDFWKPGSGIIHQVVLENYAFPGGMIIGTDSHTPNAGGLGMIAIGVGGADACDVMAGLPWELKMPKILGVELKGHLPEWSTPKDVILHLAGLLTVKGGTGYIVEYYGSGAASLSATGKATICNMGAEIGATCSIFPYDRTMVRYLIETGREEIAQLANGVGNHLRADEQVYDDPQSYYDEVIVIDLSALEPHVNGPFTPDRATPVSHLSKEAQENGWPNTVSSVLIGSCTNSSFEDMTATAELARFCLDRGIKPKTELLITPGSQMIYEALEQTGYLQTLLDFGAIVMPNACGPCIGQWARHTNATEPNTIITSFNRNFSGRNDGNQHTHAFVASPMLAMAFAIGGTLSFNPLTDTIICADTTEVLLPYFKGEFAPKGGFPISFQGLIEAPEDANGVEVVVSPDSERLQLLEPFAPPVAGLDLINLYVLIKTSGKCTTDHISPAGTWLKYRGHLDNISNNMLMGATNAFSGEKNLVKNQLTGEHDTVPLVQRAYKAQGIGSVIFGEENYGEGSSREHAAMEPRHLGVRAVIVKSFARIHETNLKKQGMLALTFDNPNDYDKIREDDLVDLMISDFKPGKQVKMIIEHKEDGQEEVIILNHTYSKEQIGWFYLGSALNGLKEQLA